MLREEPKLGRLIDGNARRDAVHVAVLPVVAADDLRPGERVGLHDKNVPSVSRDSLPHIGVVDPFLNIVVPRGQKCYVCLFPGSVVSLRHAWTCPLVPPEIHHSPSPAETWLRKYACTIYEYPEAMGEEAFARLLKEISTGKMNVSGFACYNGADLPDADTLKVHLEEYLSVSIDLGNIVVTCGC